MKIRNLEIVYNLLNIEPWSAMRHSEKKQDMLHRHHRSFGQSDNAAVAAKSQNSGFFWKKGLAEPSMSPCT